MDLDDDLFDVEEAEFDEVEEVEGIKVDENDTELVVGGLSEMGASSRIILKNSTGDSKVWVKSIPIWSSRDILVFLTSTSVTLQNAEMNWLVVAGKSLDGMLLVGFSGKFFATHAAHATAEAFHLFHVRDCFSYDGDLDNLPLLIGSAEAIPASCRIPIELSIQALVVKAVGRHTIRCI